MPSGDLTDLTRVKEQIGWDASFSGAEDTVLENMIDAASEAIEQYCRRGFHDTTYTEYHRGRETRNLILRQYPIISVTSVKSGEDQETTLTAGTDYKITECAALGMIRHASETGWALDTLYQVVYVAGYETIPEDIAQACALWVAAWYAARSREHQSQASATATGAADGSYSTSSKAWFPQLPMPHEVRQLLEPWRKHTR
jgi:uncharacterized phiE125 gp8 family phage protein